MIEEFGVLTPHLEQVLPEGMKIVAHREAIKVATKASLFGMNHHGVRLSKREIIRFKKAIFNTLEIKPSNHRGKVVLLV